MPRKSRFEDDEEEERPRGKVGDFHDEGRFPSTPRSIRSRAQRGIAFHYVISCGLGTSRIDLERKIKEAIPRVPSRVIIRSNREVSGIG